MARLLKDAPKRILRRDSEIGRRHGDAIKYRILDRYLDRVLSTTYDLVQRLALATEEVEEELFPRLLTRMRDNVLLFTEDHIGRDLAELASYFTGSLGIDGRDLRQRLDELARWHFEQLATDPALRAAVRHLLKADPRNDARDLLARPGYLSYLGDPADLRPARGCCRRRWSQVWESLLVKLKEFELVHGLRRMIVPIEVAGRRHASAASCRPAARRPPAASVRLSSATRPLDFMAALGGRPAGRALRHDLRHQRLLGRPSRCSTAPATRARTAPSAPCSASSGGSTGWRSSHRAKLEKYLGDGAFYSSREATNLLLCSIQLQRYYVEALREGLRLRPRHAHRPQLRPLPPDPDGRPGPRRGSATSSSAPASSSSRA